MSEEIVIRRDNQDIRATIYGHSSRGVVLCPPHPNYGGSREDSRLVAIAERLAAANIAALCFDYSAYTGGPEEIQDTLEVLELLRKTVTSAALLGYSYGAVVASIAAAKVLNLKGLVLISPVGKIDRIKMDLSSPVQKLFIYGVQDDFVSGGIEKLYADAKGEKQRVNFDTDHFFAGYEEALAEKVSEFLLKVLQEKG
jgi:uncharacterized protein